MPSPRGPRSDHTKRSDRIPQPPAPQSVPQLDGVSFNLAVDSRERLGDGQRRQLVAVSEADRHLAGRSLGCADDCQVRDQVVRSDAGAETSVSRYLRAQALVDGGTNQGVSVRALG